MKKFTLIELMIVVAIIGILVTLLFPSLTRAREKAKLAVCLSNNGQLARASINYSIRHNGLALWTSWYTTWGGTHGTHPWAISKRNSEPDHQLLNPYLNAPKIAWCPGDKGNPTGTNKHSGVSFGTSWSNDRWTGGSLPYLDKAFNGWHIGGDKSDYWLPPASWDQRRLNALYVAKFDRPDRKSLFVDGNLRPGNGLWSNDPNKAYRRHSTKDIIEPIGFYDGHAVIYNWWMKKIQTSTATAVNPAAGQTLQWRWDNLKIY